MTPQDLIDVAASVREQLPWAEPVPVEALSSRRLPTLVISGGWPSATGHPTMASTARIFSKACDALAGALGAERVTFPEAHHNAQLLGAPFNEQLEQFWARAARVVSAG